MLNFSTGAGFNVAMVVHEIAVWLATLGLDHRAATLLYNKLSSRYGAARFRVHQGHVQVLRDGAWQQAIHRDDVRNFLYGARVPVKIGKAPDPAERGVKIKVGVMTAEVTPGKDGKLGTKDDTVKITPRNKAVVEYEELDDGRFQCEACGKILKTEKGIVAHIEREH